MENTPSATPRGSSVATEGKNKFRPVFRTIDFINRVHLKTLPDKHYNFRKE